MPLDRIDLRDWLRAVADLGEVHDVHGAHWDLEIGAVSEANYRRDDPPALLFDDVVGYRQGLRVLTGSTADAVRLGVTLRLGDRMSDHELVDALRGAPARWLASAPDFPAVEVTSGPVCENVVKGAEADLLTYPVPRWHENDGGRYIGTGCAVFTIDPGTGQVNAGAYRMQVQHDGRAASVNMEAGKHGAMHVREWFEREGRAPVTVSLGH
ncbi:MAG: UbiD family decarboxylase, partial [Streptosporangiales bacterium]|nr:UbiD family decarboxylase [Streptosporangiales bacterium]